MFEERYRIDALIGTGGFAKVYRATQTDLGRDVALKIMLPEEKLQNLLEDSQSTDGHRLSERFLQEARVVAKLRDPHTVTMHDHGRSRDGLLYMVFEHIDGLPLSRLIRTQGALEPRRVTKILRQTLSSLQEAHAMGMLHRDIKPGNIMIYEHVGRPDQVKVLDFGIAKVVGHQQVKQDLREDLTTNGALLGTPRYMSPEQIRGQDLTPASDLYSLGLVAYEMLTGHKAIDSNSSVIVIGAQLDPRSFSVPNTPQIPAGLRTVVNRMLEKDRNLRYQSVDDVLAELSRLDTGTFPAAAFSPVAAGASNGDEMPDLSDSLEPFKVAQAEEEEQRRASARRILIAAIFGLCVFIGVGLGVILLEPAARVEAPVAELAPPAADPAVSPTPAPEPLVDEPAVDQPVAEEVGAEQVAGKEAAEEQAGDGPAAVQEITITTTPADLDVFVNDELVGKSPVTVNTDAMAFPARIRAVLSTGESRRTMLNTPVAKVALDLSMFAERPSAEPEQPKPRPKPSPKPRPKPKPKPPAEEPDDDFGGLRLPALD